MMMTRDSSFWQGRCAPTEVPLSGNSARMDALRADGVITLKASWKSWLIAAPEEDLAIWGGTTPHLLNRTLFACNSGLGSR